MEQGFGRTARAQRVKARVSLRDLGQQLGWSPVYISDIERGSRNAPSPEKAQQWAAAIGGDPEEFARLAMESRGSIELPTTQRPDLALQLARKWRELTDDEADRLKQILSSEEEGQRIDPSGYPSRQKPK